MAWTDKIETAAKEAAEARKQESAMLLATLLPLPLEKRRSVPLTSLTVLTDEDRQSLLTSLAQPGMAATAPETSAIVLDTLMAIPVEQRRSVSAEVLARLTGADMARFMMALLPAAPTTAHQITVPLVPREPARPRRKTRLGPPPQGRISWWRFHAIEWSRWACWALPRHPIWLLTIAILLTELVQVGVRHQWGGYEYQLAWTQFFAAHPSEFLQAITHDANWR